jgi:Tfp pilus assembly protein PilF
MLPDKRNDTSFPERPPEQTAAAEVRPETAIAGQRRQGKIPKSLGIGVLLLVLLTVVGILSRLGHGRLEQPVPPLATVQEARVDPRLHYQGPYRNIHPDVGYVGDASCLSCHPKETVSFREHPMGRSLLPIAQVAPQQVYDKVHNNPFQALGSQFIVERQGDKIWHRQKRQDEAGNFLVDYAMEAHYVIGSGHGGYSYLTDRDGYLFQTPISWFTQKQIWDLSPSFDSGSLVGRPIDADCLFCHANRARNLPGYKNRYEQPIFDGCVIGCERCHGPGGRHIESTEKLDIVNPKKLTAALSDAVCEQCHLNGMRVLPYGRQQYDFRPGLPREEFFSVFTLASKSDEERPAVMNVEQLHESRCYLGSSGEEKLRCVSCHNPHQYVGPSQRVAYYRARCLACHEKQGCSLPREVRLQKSKEDSCIDCHMPRQRATDVPHTANTDHRILRKAGSRSAQAASAFEIGSKSLLKPFGGRRIKPGDRQAQRDLGIALIRASGRGALPRDLAADQALVLLERGLAEDDSDAWEAKGWANLLRDKAAEARVAFEKALALQPQREVALTGAADAAAYAGQADAAVEYSRRAVAVNPWIPAYRRQLALLLMEKQLWDEVRAQCQAWMRLDPANAEARMLWVSCLIRAGEKEKARQEFARIEALQPPNLQQLRARFAQQMR